MRQLLLGIVSVASLRPSSGAAAQSKVADGWRDSVRHKVGYVTVVPGVRIHYLDFGGTGPPVVLLAGLGNTAHAFDDFAPRLTDRFRVVAITRRGFGESSHPRTGYDTQRLVEDIRQVADRLHLGRLILIGHSIAGEEMTRFAASDPDRIAKMVYLDAAYDRVAADSILAVVFPVPPNVPSAPAPTGADTATPSSYVAFVHRTRGVNIPEADIRTRFRYDGWNEVSNFAYQAIRSEHPRYRAVRASALAVYAVTDTVTQLEPWQRDDAEHAAAWQEVIRGVESVSRTLRAQFRVEADHGAVLEIHGAHHWIFVSNRDEVVSAVRRFLIVP
ncbi:MAG TPA: alpha/beta hydrolase [Gemmatimonadaceae bacterium]